MFLLTIGNKLKLINSETEEVRLTDNIFNDAN